MHRVNRCTLAGTAWARPALTSIRLTIARSQGAHHAAPPPAPLGLRFRALLGLGFVPPPEPRPCAHCASIAYALLPAARVPLCRHRADPESSSRSLPSGSSARIAPIAPTARIAPIAPAARRCPRSPLALRRPRGHGWQESHRMHPFFAECAKKAPSWQLLPEMHAFRDQDGNILALCIHFRAQSGDSGYMARESCRQGPSFASRNPKSRMTRRCCQRHAAAACDTRHGRTGFAPCGAGLACLLHAPPLSSRLCPPRPALPAISPAFIAAVLHASRFAARIAPTHAAIRRAAHCGRDELSIGLFLPPSCCPRRRIAPIDARSPAPPGPQPAPTEPQPRANRTPSPEPTGPRSPVEPSAPTRAPPPAAPHPAARVPLRFR